MKHLALAVLLALPGAAFAEHKNHSAEVHRHHQVAVASSAASSQPVELTAGEVRKVDRGAGEIIVKHARIKSMDMPAMTMPFSVRETGMLDQVKVGDRIRFAAEVIGDRPTITRIAR
jgi:Cu(I)/Ag(I) efflux system periplasmic protein CusF